MRNIVFLLLLNVLLSVKLPGQQKVFSNFDSFESEVLNAEYSDTLVLLNFWATWCVPCVEELPVLKETLNNPPKIPYKLIFVSLDGTKDKMRLRKFVLKNMRGYNVISLTDNKYNSWLGKVDHSWSGSIPASLILYKDRKLLLEKKFTRVSEIRTDIENWLLSIK
jgi:thiol-disulfide isomerase/thioredoxin